jgi:DNA-binding transcriptional regulator YdaS (Cro superfamily)
VYSITLLDKAHEVCRSDAATARAIGVSPQLITEVRAGRKKLPPERAALLAELVGEDASYALQRVTLDNAKPELLTRLQRAFRVAAGVVGAAVLVATAAVPSSGNAGTIRTDREALTTTASLSVYTLSRLLAALLWMARRRRILGHRPRPRRSLHHAIIAAAGLA